MLVCFPNVSQNKLPELLSDTSLQLWRTDLVLAVVIVLQSRHSHVVPVGVHAGQDVDAGGVDDGLDALVAQQILGAHVLSQEDQQLAAQDLVPVHVAHVLHLWLHYRHINSNWTVYKRKIMQTLPSCTHVVHVVRGFWRTR